jgi:hypothetical protein
LVAPAIVGAGAVGWYGATSALRAANSITRA